jgi:hypothetical protein
VIAADDVMPSTFTTHFRSAVVFGRAEIEHHWKRMCAVELAIEHTTGKAAIEIIKEVEVGRPS